MSTAAPQQRPPPASSTKSVPPYRPPPVNINNNNGRPPVKISSAPGTGGPGQGLGQNHGGGGGGTPRRLAVVPPGSAMINNNNGQPGRPANVQRLRPIKNANNINNANNTKADSSSSGEEGRLFSSIYTLLGFGNHEYAFGPVPRGYGLTILSIASCYALLKWERSRIEKSKNKPPFTAQSTWFARLKSAEKEYSLARNDFPRTVALMLVGGLGMPCATAVGGLFWVAGRATDFHEMEKRSHPNTDPVFVRFGKFLMICGVCKFCFDFARGRISHAINSS